MSVTVGDLSELRCPVDALPLWPLAAGGSGADGASDLAGCERGHRYACEGHIVDLAPETSAPGFGRLRAATYDLTFDWVNVRRLFGSSPKHLTALHRAAAEAAAAGASTGRGVLLDVGCGTGRWALGELAAARYPRYLGVDSSMPMLRLAQKAARRDHPEASVVLVHSEAERLPLGDATVAAALCSLGLQFVADHPAALAELHRVLAPNGQLFIVAPALGLREPYDRRHAERARKDHPIDRARWPEQLAGAGFVDPMIEIDGSLVFTQATAT
jgi:SAM-dependent methyltransferase